MMTGKTICFLLFFIYIVSTQLIQKDVDEFIRNQNFIPPTATMSSFKEENGKGIAIYKDGNTKFKIIVGKNYSLGQMFLIFREQQTEINFSNGFVQTSNRHINNFPFPAHQQFEVPNQAMNMMMQPLIPIRPISPIEFNMKESSPFFSHRKGMMKNRAFGKIRNPFIHQCQLKKDEIQSLLKQNLLIFKNAQITSIKKVGFERGVGLILDIFFTDQKKQYKAIAGYMPRHKKLTIIKLEELQSDTTTVDQIPNQVTQTTDSNLAFKTPSQDQTIDFNFQNLIQSFVEKLMLRRNLQIPLQREPIINDQVSLPDLGDHSEINKPLLLGSEGEPENRNELISQDAKVPLIPDEANKLGSKFVSGEEKEEEISELVNEVIGKLKLKLK